MVTSSKYLIYIVPLLKLSVTHQNNDNKFQVHSKNRIVILTINLSSSLQIVNKFDAWTQLIAKIVYDNVEESWLRMRERLSCSSPPHSNEFCEFEITNCQLLTNHFYSTIVPPMKLSVTTKTIVTI